MPLSITDKLLLLVGMATGVAAFIGTQSVTKAWADPILEACASADLFEERKLRPYEPMLGGGFICMLTQFFYELAKDPAGLIVWVTLTGLFLPASMPMYLEAGKAGARGPVRYPMVTFFLAIVLGIGVVMPAIWFPSYLFFRGEGAVSPSQSYVSTCISISFLIGTICLFVLDINTYEWTWTVSFFLGPIAAVFPLALLFCPAAGDSRESVQQGARACSLSYLGVAFLSFGSWVVVVLAASHEYGTDLTALWEALWTDAGTAVAFMMIDTAGYYVGTLCYLFKRNPRDALLSLILTPLLGPGCSVALAMARQELKVVEMIHELDATEASKKKT